MCLKLLQRLRVLLENVGPACRGSPGFGCLPPCERLLPRRREKGQTKALWWKGTGRRIREVAEGG